MEQATDEKLPTMTTISTGFDYTLVPDRSKNEKVKAGTDR